MAEFSSLDNSQPNIPYSNGSNPYGLDLTNPDNVLSGQNRGTQSIGGSANIQSDPTNQRLVVNDNTANRVSFGRIGTGVNDWGMKVSKPGFSVDTATSDQLIFNSSQDVFKIVQTGTISCTLTGFTGTAGVYTLSSSSTPLAHGLSYTPMISGFLNVDSGATYLPMPYTALNNFGAGPTWTTYAVSTDATNITLQIRLLMFGAVTTTTSTVTMKYYLLQESAN